MMYVVRQTNVETTSSNVQADFKFLFIWILCSIFSAWRFYYTNWYVPLPVSLDFEAYA